MKRIFFASIIGLSSYLQALPTNGEVKAGNASIISHSGTNNLNVEANGKAIIHWDQFHIDNGEKVSFHQSQPQMAVLNRVTGGSPSKILGELNANCPIYLINGKGVFIGPHAQISTAGFLASTAEISNDSFLAHKELAFHQLQEGEIVNLGSITCPKGDVILIARFIRNSGKINAPEGQVTFKATEMVIHPNEKKQVFIRPDQTVANEGIINQGIIEAQAIHLETSSPYAQAINHTGEIKAYQSAEKNGRILLVAHQGGVECKGNLIAPAGTIDIKAKDIAIRKGSIIETSSTTGGGSISLSGTQTTLVDKGAKLCAKGSLQGDKGKARIITKEGTFAILGEVSADEVLYDPKFVNIQPDGADYDPNNPFTFNDGTDIAVINGSSLQSSLNSGSVTIQADTDIAFNDTVNVTTQANGLTLQAGRSISMTGKLTLNEGDFSATINDENAVERDAGVASFSITGVSFDPSEIKTNGGDIVISVGNYGSQQEGTIDLASSEIDAGGGDISLVGYGALDQRNNASGIVISDYSKVQTSGPGLITLTGTGGNGASGCHGVYLPNSTALISGENGTININGTGGGATGNMNSGLIHAGTLQTTGNGDIELTGKAIAGANLNTGVCFVSGGSATITNGNLILKGTGTGTGDQNYGIRFESESSCSSSGSGQIQLIGSSSGGVNNNHGVILSNSYIKSEAGAISLKGDGQGSGDYNYGVRLESMASITSTDTATITIQGENKGGAIGGVGVSISSDQDTLSTVNGNITITGTSSGTGDMNQGFRLDGGAIRSTGTGSAAANIAINGTGSPTGTGSEGVVIGGYQVAVTSVDGNITITGSASGDNTPYTVDTNAVESTGSGSVTYDPPQPL